MVTEREAKRRRSGVPSGPADAAAGEYNFAAKAGPYMEREAWLQSQEAKGGPSGRAVVLLKRVPPRAPPRRTCAAHSHRGDRIRVCGQRRKRPGSHVARGPEEHLQPTAPEHAQRVHYPPGPGPAPPVR